MTVCAYALGIDPKFKCPKCRGDATFEIRDYYRKPRADGSTNMPLCTEHAGWWNDNHPFGPTAIPSSVPKGMEKN